MATNEARQNVNYVSTRGEAPALSFEDVLLTGLARDGGLTVPETYPRLDTDGLAGLPFDQLAARVIAPFTTGSIEADELARLTASAYRDFGHPAVAPLVQIGPDRFVLELFHGPTLAFKDVAMRLLARLLDRALERRGARATIIGATSGDTGGAAVEAFGGSKRVDVFVLYPDGRVSEVQRRMMTTAQEDNVHALAIEGTFDDCQGLVKAMFVDQAFRDRVRLTGVNSINWARIVAQVTYYFAAAVALGAPARDISFAVPTGNFGDVFAGYVARRMGAPIDRLIIATNANDILVRTHATGVYEVRGVEQTSSPSMDIQVSSNFERYLFEATGRNGASVRAMMGSLAQSGCFELGAAAAGAMRTDFDAARASEAEVAAAIAGVDRECSYVLDPHTACGIVALDKLRRDRSGTKVALATAHPAKFPDAIERVLGRRPALPSRLAGLMAARERQTVLPKDLATVERFVGERTRAARTSA